MVRSLGSTVRTAEAAIAPVIRTLPPHGSVGGTVSEWTWFWQACDPTSARLHLLPRDRVTVTRSRTGDLVRLLR
jgi:hypothetical protein